LRQPIVDPLLRDRLAEVNAVNRADDADDRVLAQRAERVADVLDN
jgi:hypothetical protein